MPNKTRGFAVLTPEEWKSSLCFTCRKTCRVAYAVVTMCTDHEYSVPKKYKQTTIFDTIQE